MGTVTQDFQAEAPVSAPVDTPVCWRVEGSLVDDLSLTEAVAYFASHALSFFERVLRRAAFGVGSVALPLLFASDRIFATRALHAFLRGMSRDRLDLLGEEYVDYVLQRRLRRHGVEQLQRFLLQDGRTVLVSQGLDHVIRPLARRLGAKRILCNRLEFRDGFATGRLLEPVLYSHTGLAHVGRPNGDGRVQWEELVSDLGLADRPHALAEAVRLAERWTPRSVRPTVLFSPRQRIERFSVRASLAEKKVLLIGVTGFIGKVWLAHALEHPPEIGRLYLLIRRKGPTPARRRFERILETSPVFDPLAERYGGDLARVLRERVEVVEGDVSRPDLGLEPALAERLAAELDLIINSSGLTDFNPDLREALVTNVDATAHLLAFLRRSHHAALLHLSTCYVAGARDGRVHEELEANYSPLRLAGFDAEKEWQALWELVRRTEARAESPEMTEELQAEARKRVRGRALSEKELANHVRRYRSRWLRTQLTELGVKRARALGWPNTYTFTKSLAESLIARRGRELPIAIVRPSIVETSIEQPFRGWNEGINTSAPLSHLLGTYFRQLPTNERKCLDLIPVDLVCRGLTLIAAALVRRCHDRVYQLATSEPNPCNMQRSIELTGLAHRKHYRAQEGLESWLRAEFATIPVSKRRYRRLSAPGQRTVVHLLRLLLPLRFVRARLERHERKLARVEKIIELYEPFILHNEHVFEADNVARLSAALPEAERELFGYDAGAVDWWDYWINIHVPALRKWVYPLIEGRPPEAGARRSLPASALAVSRARQAGPAAASALH